MGCDYYIYKKLCIYLKNSDKNFDIELETERGYFYDINMDEDDERYEDYNNWHKEFELEEEIVW